MYPYIFPFLRYPSVSILSCLDVPLEKKKGNEYFTFFWCVGEGGWRGEGSTEFVEALFKVANILRDVESHKLKFAPIDQRTISSCRDLQRLLKVVPSEPTKKKHLIFIFRGNKYFITITRHREIYHQACCLLFLLGEAVYCPVVNRTLFVGDSRIL